MSLRVASQPSAGPYGVVRRFSFGICAALIASSAGCNALVDPTTDQCSSDADCTSKGPAFATTVCTRDRICASRSCTTHTECSALMGVTAYCRPDHVCARVMTDECQQLIPADALTHDEVILTGFMGPVRGQHGSYGTPLRQGAELALAEIERINGIPGVDGGPQRHLAMLVCHDGADDASDASDAQRPLRVARHLAETLQVPAIIGPADSKIALEVITEVTTRAGVLSISPAATDPALANLPRAGRAWRTVPSDDLQFGAIVALQWMAVSDLVQRGWMVASPPTAYVAPEDNEGHALAVGYLSSLLDEGRPQGFSYGADHGSVDWVAKAREIVQARPALLLAFGGTEFVTELLPRVEQEWGSSAPKPYYLLTKRALVRELLTEVEKNPDLGKRIVGIGPGARNSAPFREFKTRFQLAFGAPAPLAEFAYDATYLLAYAIGLTKVQRPTGAALDEAMRNMSCPTGGSVAAHPSMLLNGFRLAAQSECLNFDGTSGALDFDSARREAPGDLGLWCAGRDASGAPELRVIEQVYFDSTHQVFTNVEKGALLPFCWATP